VTLFGAALLIGLGNIGPLHLRAGQLAAYFIMVSHPKPLLKDKLMTKLKIGGCAIAYYLVLAMVSSNVLGTTKKTTTNVILFISMAVSYLVG